VIRWLAVINDPGPWVKFWWKGVDIVADVVKNVLTAGIIAVAAFLTWSQKKKLELHHNRALKEQEEQLNRAFALERNREDSRRLHEQTLLYWRSELTSLVNELLVQRTIAKATSIRDRYVAWLEANRLSTFQRNQRIISSWRVVTFVDDQKEEINKEEIDDFLTDIFDTAFPLSDDETFP
jgi:hypothetical protein